MVNAKTLTKASLLLLLLLFYTAIMSTPSHAASWEIKVIINGEMQQYDQPPVLENGRTLVPLRGIFETLGAKVNWNQKEGKVTASKGDKTIELTIGSKKAKINEQLHHLDAAAKTINNRTMVPLRFIGEALGEDVLWEQATKTVYIGNRLEHNSESISDVVAKVKDIYEDAGAKIYGDGGIGYTAFGNGVSHGFNGNVLVIFYSESSTNYSVAAEAINKLGGSGDESKIADAIEQGFSDGKSRVVGNVTIKPLGRGIQISW
ncbi:hypothetical protein YSY43_15580 [Paenibacillus sp. YSY-4.3]